MNQTGAKRVYFVKKQRLFWIVLALWEKKVYTHTIEFR